MSTNGIELAETLSEFGITAPERCIDCPRLGELASRLSLAHSNRDFLVTSSDESTLILHTREQLIEQFKDVYPDATDGQIDEFVSNSIADFLGSEKYGGFLKQTATHLDEEDSVIATTLEEVEVLFGSCPPEGCPATDAQ